MNNPATNGTHVTPERIMQTGLGFWGSKTLLAAVKLGVFTELGGNKKLSGKDIQSRLKLHDRGVYDFLDGLVAMGFLERTGLLETAAYSNTTETELFLDKNKPTYTGGILEMANDRLFRFWADLDEALITGKPQNELKTRGVSMFEELYADPERLKQFMQAMTGISTGNFIALAQKFDFSRYKTLVDIGGATGALSIHVANHQPHMHCTTMDLPPVAPIADETIAQFGVGDRVKTGVVDFFTDEFPKADVITMGMILHDWNLEQKRALLATAYDALPEGGALVVYEALIDDDRSQNAFGLLMSLNMLIETPGGFDYTGADCSKWMRDAGFKSTRVEHLVGPDSMVIGIK